MLVEPVHLLPDVPEVLERVGRHARLVLITKGDLVHQTRKVTTSGLEHHFTDIEIVLEKDPTDLRQAARPVRCRARTVLHGRQLGAQRRLAGHGDRRPRRPRPVPPHLGARTSRRPHRRRRRRSTASPTSPPGSASTDLSASGGARRHSSQQPVLHRRTGGQRRSETSELDSVDAVVLAFAQDQRGSVAGGSDVLAQVDCR